MSNETRIVKRTDTSFDVLGNAVGLEIEVLQDFSSTVHEEFTAGGSVWMTGTDSSVYDEYDNFRGYEYRCKTTMDNALNAINGLYAHLRLFGAILFNTSCGMHVHVNFPFAHTNIRAALLLRKILYYVGYAEKALYISTGSPQRANGRYAKAIEHLMAYTKDFDFETTGEVNDFLDAMREICTKYQSVNFTPLLRRYYESVGSYKRTIEFRFPEGTESINRIELYLAIISALVGKASVSKRCTPALYARHAHVQNMETPLQTTDRVLRQFGIVPGNENSRYGIVTPQNRKRICATARDLAETYAQVDLYL